jgi:hypothetical protein
MKPHSQITLTRKALVRAKAGAPLISEKQERQVYAVSTGSLAGHADRPGAAHGVFDELEGDGIADHELVEGRALGYVASMEEHLSIVLFPDEPLRLADQQS